MLNPLQDNPFLQVEFIQKVVDDVILTDPNYTLIDKHIPNRDQLATLGTDIMWDVDIYDEGGMTPVVDVSRESPIITGGGARQMKVSPPHFREKAILDGTDILNLRQLGTQNTQKTMRDLITKWTVRLRRRMDNRRLFNKWQAVQSFSALTLLGVGGNQAMDYSGVGFHDSLAAGAMWDVAGPVPSPIEDLVDIIAGFRSLGTIPKTAYFGSTIMEAMLRNDSLNTIIEQQIYRNVNPNNVYNASDATGIISFLTRIFAGVEFVYAPAGPIVSLKTVKASPAGGATVVAIAGNTELFRIGETVTVSSHTGARFSTTITAITPANGTITLAAMTLAMPKGSLIRKRYEFMDYDKLVVFGEMPNGQTGGQLQAEHVSVANIHVDGGLDNPRSGIGVRLIQHPDDDPPKVEMIISVTEATVVYHDEGPWSVHKVIT